MKPKHVKSISQKKWQSSHFPKASTPRELVLWLFVWQPVARHVRSEDYCPQCAEPTFCSYILTEFYRPTTSGYESCGYYCGHCGFGSAGTRETIDPIAALRREFAL